MNHARMIEQLDNALIAAASAPAAQSLQRFFTEPVAALGVSNAQVRRIAAAAVAAHPQLAPKDHLAVANHFAQSQRYHEHFMLASSVASSVASSLAATAARRTGEETCFLAWMKTWLERDARNWAQCDDVCIKPLYLYLYLYLYLQRRSQLLDQIATWGSSEGSWCRRASCVALVKFVGRTPACDLAPILANCERLLGDSDPYVQKGIGWILKVAGQYEPQRVQAFLQRHAVRMERSTLRYAIEKLAPATRRQFLA